MPTTSLPRATPQSQGVDAAGIDAFLDRIESAPDIELHSLMVVRHGHVVAEGWWAPYTADQPHLLYSLSKSFTSTALALAVDERLVELDATVLSYFPELDADITDPRSRSMLVRHVAAMASGHLDETIERAHALGDGELIRGFLTIPPDRDPGTVFAYNQPCTYSLSRIVQRQSGQTLREFLRPRLFEPLGIDEYGWLTDADGREIGYSGMHTTTESIAKLGLLYLQFGQWDGEQLLSPYWVSEATRAQVATPDRGVPDWEQGYGFQFWIARHGFRGDGAFGQFCIVLPDLDAVIAITAQTENLQGVLDAVWETILPALGEERPGTGADDELAERLAGLALTPAAGGAPEPTAESTLMFVPAGGVCDAQPSLMGVELERTADGWTITLLEGSEHISSLVVSGEWTTNLDGADGGRVAVPIAVSGGWVDEHAFVADVIFLQTPHRLSLRCSVDDQTFTATWRTTPLRTSLLTEMRMPR